MRRATLLALGLMLVGIWSLDDARGQTSSAPPVSLAPPKASPPRANARNSPAASDRVPSTPAIGGLPQAPTSAADYDGFSAGNESRGIPDQATRPAASRTARGAKSSPDTTGNVAQELIDQEDEALKRKLTICRSCN